MRMRRLIIFGVSLFLATGAYATSLHDVDMAWSRHNLYTINLLAKLREIADAEAKNPRHKEQILQFTEAVNVINERVYDCYIICELVSLNDDRSKAYLDLAREFTKTKQNEINEKVEWLKVLSSLARKDKNQVLVQMLDDYVNLCIETVNAYSQCFK